MARDKCIHLAFILVLVTLFLIFHNSDTQWKNINHFTFPTKDSLPHIKSKATVKSSRTVKNLKNKWIVITTVAYPTSAVVALAAESEWRVVVVADTKTPTDWNHTNCDFLSIEKQNELAYSINPLIPFKSYTRKMIGYLYAIQNGAQWIYDTDDDNQPIGRKV